MIIEQSIIPQLGRTVKFLDFYVEEELAKRNIPLSKLQVILLFVISKNNGETQSCLADLTARDKTTFTRNISTLERKKLVYRESSKGDKRIKLVFLSALGKQYLEQAKPIIEKVVSVVEADISEEERERFLATLHKIKQKIKALRS